MVKTWRDPGKCLFKRNQGTPLPKENESQSAQFHSVLKGRGGDKFPDTVCNLNIPADFHGPSQFQHFWVKYLNAQNAA